MARMPYIPLGRQVRSWGTMWRFCIAPNTTGCPILQDTAFLDQCGARPPWLWSLVRRAGNSGRVLALLFVPSLLALVPMRRTSASQPASQNLQTIRSAGGGGYPDYLKHRAPQAPLGTTVAPTLSTVQYVLARGIMFRAVQAHSRHPLATLRVATSCRCVSKNCLAEGTRKQGAALLWDRQTCCHCRISLWPQTVVAQR